MASSKILISSDQITDCAVKIKKHDENIMDILERFEREMRNVEACWVSEACEEMREAFSQLKPAFNKFHNYNEKVCTHLITNVAEARNTLDASLKNNASGLKRSF